MKILINTPEKLAQIAAQRYVELLHTKPDAVLGYATGSTPVGLYQELARFNQAGKLSFKKATTYNLDEYVGLEGTHDQSYRYFMNDNLFHHIDIPIENTHVPAGLGDLDQIAADYEHAIEAAGGIDLQLLGIGHNGHIGFNEPGTPFGSVTHQVKLTESSITANSRFFASKDEVPKTAITMGIKTCMNARSIIFIALGKSKAEIVRKMLTGPVTEMVPASVLQLHPFVEIYLDQDAASLL
ncbi:MAG: glucosamine-6-phosphate deaminase [Clostridia bacterium]